MSKRIDSTAAVIAAMTDAASALPMPPKCVRLREGDIPFYETLVRAR